MSKRLTQPVEFPMLYLHLSGQGQTDLPGPFGTGAKPRRAGSVVARKRGYGWYGVKDE